MSIPFIQAGPSGQFEVTADAVRLFSSLKGKIIPIVVAGIFRSGKSSLLNFFVNEFGSSRSSAASSAPSFEVGSSIKSVTRGLHIWASPIDYHGAKLVFIDSEGLNSTNQNNTFDTQIFSLSVLLSSVFMLNARGVIDEATIENLELVVKMTEKIQVEQNNGNTANQKEKRKLDQFAAHFPAFIFVLRDFSLDLEFDGVQMTPNQYLEHSLQSQPMPKDSSNVRAIQEKNRIRETLRTVFPVRECFPLVRPTVDERQLKNVSSLPLDRLRPEFRDQVRALKDRILQLAQPKSINGEYLNGPAFVALAKSYVSAFNSGAVPTILSAWQNVVELQSRELLQRIMVDIDTKTSKLGESMLEESEIVQAFEELQQFAASSFNESAVGSDAQKHQFLCQLKSNIDTIRKKFMDYQRLKGQEHCRSVLDRLWNELAIDQRWKTGKLRRNDEFIHLLDEFQKKYFTECRGFGREQRFREFYSSKLKEWIGDIWAKWETANKEAETAKSRAAAVEKELQSTSEQLRMSQKEAAYRSEERSRLESELVALRKDSERLALESARLQAEHREFQRLQKEFKEIESCLEREREKRIRLEVELEERQRQLADKRDLEGKIKEMEGSKVGMKEEMKELKEENRKMKEFNRKLESSVEEQAAAMEKTKKAAKEERERIEREAKNRITALEGEAKQWKSEFEAVSKRLADLERARAVENELRGKENDNRMNSGSWSQSSGKSSKRSSASAELSEEEVEKRGAAGRKAAKSDANERKSRSGRVSDVFQRQSIEPDEQQMDQQFEPDQGDFDIAPPLSEEEQELEAEESEQEEEPVQRKEPKRGAAKKSSASAGSDRPLVDPQSLSIAQLKSWLTELNIILGFADQKKPKPFYVDLIMQHVPELRELYGAQAAEEGKKPKSAKKAAKK